jgi:hypothetical protein
MDHDKIQFGIYCYENIILIISTETCYYRDFVLCYLLINDSLFK